jgi:hypothetical protein
MSQLDPKYLQASELLTDIRTLIAEARRHTAVAVNMGLTFLYRQAHQPGGAGQRARRLR